MKKNIEKKSPIKMNLVAFRDKGADAVLFTKSTLDSKETMEKDGKKYFVIDVEVSSVSHPFYTGKGNIIDSTGRVDKFRKRVAKKK